MWRDKFIEIKKQKGVSTQTLADISGLSKDTIKRMLNTTIHQKEGPGIETIATLCSALGIEMWELFYVGDKSFVDLQAELAAMNVERDNLVADNAVLRNQVEELHKKIEELKDELLDTHRYYIKSKETK